MKGKTNIMRIAYLSDLHLEFETGPKILSAGLKSALAPAAGVDLLVLAGDIAQGVDAVALADAMSDHVGAPVVYVAGNHEGYGEDYPTLLRRLAEAAWNTDGRVWFLDAQSARFWFSGCPIVVLGCTLWTDYAFYGDTHGAMTTAAAAMSDHKVIGWNGAPFSPEHALSLHMRHRDWLENQMAAIRQESVRPAVLVVTHHAPCRAGVGGRVTRLAPSYATDMETDMGRWGNLVWIHGHTHHRHETVLGQARIVSAPRGYASEPYAAGFSCGVVEI